MVSLLFVVNVAKKMVSLLMILFLGLGFWQDYTKQHHQNLDLGSNIEQTYNKQHKYTTTSPSI